MKRKTWLITGASSGLGLALARHAIAQGDNVVATARSLSVLAEFQATMPERICAAQLDVTNAIEAQAAAQTAVQRFGGIDLLINNAGYGVVGAVEETSETELRALMETNFFGAGNVLRAVLPTLRAQGHGAIINVSSLGGQLSFPGFGPYSASKFALEGLSEALRAELAPFGIKVLILEPGELRTAFAGQALRHMPEMPAYVETVGSTRSFARSMDGQQNGDPEKVGQAIEAALGSDKTPLRLQLGSDAVSMVRAHSNQMLAELAEWEALARSIDIENPADKASGN